jgi:HAD superfamily hydrolase (TIGR01509 family)
MFTGKKAIFWDNDGILVDTEKYYFEATRQIMGVAGFELTKELYIDLFLIQAKGAWHLLDPEKYPPEIISNLREERDNLYQNMLLTEYILIQGIEEVVSQLSLRYKMAIVTSSKTRHFYAIHSRTGLLKYFDFVITPENYTQYKPNPEPYLVAINKMGIEPEEGIVIEDSLRGLTAAKAAGLQCIVVPGELTRTSDFSKADYILDDIRNLMAVL